VLNLKRKKKGFTLLEAIIVLALITIVALVIYPFFFSSSRSFNETNIRSDLQSDGQVIQDSFLNYGNQGSSISRINGTIPPDNSNAITTLSSIKFTMYSDITKTVEYVYDSTNKRLNEITTNLDGSGAVTNKVLSNNVDGIKISSIGGNYVSCDGLVINVTLKQKDISYDISSKVVFRNKGIVTY
jgi:prepilin-type N-terminal cleavage/methylation domain-containing protein